jgi:hypothetical protein
VGQLVAMVGGAGSQKARGERAKPERHHLHLKLEHKLHANEKAASKAHGFGKSDEVLHKIAGHGDKAQPAGKVIPLDSTEDNLHQFNN